MKLGLHSADHGGGSPVPISSMEEVLRFPSAAHLACMSIISISWSSVRIQAPRSRCVDDCHARLVRVWAAHTRMVDVHTGRYAFFPSFLLFGYLGYSVSLWRRFVEQGTFIQVCRAPMSSWRETSIGGCSQIPYLSPVHHLSAVAVARLSFSLGFRHR